MIKLLFCLVMSTILAQNLNTLHSIIYEDAHKASGIEQRRSLFGYTTALHRGKNKARIFIGAPKGEDVSLPIFNPGVVFQCGIKQFCDMLSLDNNVGQEKSGNFTYLDGKDNAWIGGTMDISPDTNYLVICGFRWTATSIYSQGIKRMVGVCYLSNLEAKHRFEKLVPLIDPRKSTWGFKQGTVYFYSFGQAGFSAHITNDKQHPNIILGAPGLLNWWGASILYSNLHTPSSLDYKVSRQQENNFALFGYAVSSGHFTEEYNKLYASSSPKGNNYLGIVTLYKFGASTDKFIDKKYILTGSQMGEYFGATLSSGDLNNDGYDDLIIGAPFYSDKLFNDGRVHIYYGKKERSDFTSKDNVVHLYGANDGGHFGAAITFLGDINLDGYGDLAVGEPFGNQHRGRVYIYHGGQYGLVTKPAQILQANYIDHYLRGFGVSISKSVDIDGNGYPDIAIGSHLSGHAVIVRSNPLLEIDTFLQIVHGTKINIGNTTFEHCYMHAENPYLPKHISIRRKFTIDESYQRVILHPSTTIQKDVILQGRHCETFILLTKDKLYYLTEPVKISISYELVEAYTPKSNFYVGSNALNNTDIFCKTCPVLLNERPFEAEFSFGLGCGDDDVCNSNLNFDAKFFDIKNNIFIIGSTDVIRMEVLVSNSGDSAYLTQLSITLPSFVRFNSNPKKCTEEVLGTLVCLVGNPLNNQVYLPVHINTKDVSSHHGTNLTFWLNVTTTSENKLPIKQKSVTLQLQNVVDLKLHGKGEPSLLFYNNNSTFKQVYEIQKLGPSPAEDVSLTIELPTHIVKNNVKYSFLKLYSILGSLRGQPLLCRNHSEIEYINEITNIIASDIVEEEVILSRSLRETHTDLIYSSNINKSVVTEIPDAFSNEYSIEEEEGDKIIEGTLLDCKNNLSSSNSYIQCTKFTCDIGTIKQEQDVAVVRIKALLDVVALRKLLKIENTILLTSYGYVDAEFDSGITLSNNQLNITSTFLYSREFRLDMWILIVSTMCGLFLLMITTCILYKCGFFTRTKKLQLEEEMRQAATDEFLNNCEQEHDLEELDNHEDPLDLIHLEVENTMPNNDQCQ